MLRGIYSIKGPAQVRSSDWGEALNNNSFKERLIGLLIEAWKDDSCARILKTKTAYANYNNCCYKYRAENGVTISTEQEQIFSSQKEAENRIFFHLIHALPGRTVLMGTADTDSLVIALGYITIFQCFENLVRSWSAR